MHKRRDRRGQSINRELHLVQEVRDTGCTCLELGEMRKENSEAAHEEFSYSDRESEGFGDSVF